MNYRKIFIISVTLLFLSLNTVSVSELPEINVENISPSAPGPGESFSVDIKLAGGRESFESEGVSVETVEGIRSLGTTSGLDESFDLCAGCRRTGRFYFRVEEDTSAGTYPIKFVAEGVSGVGSVASYEVRVEADSVLVFNSEKVETVPGESVKADFSLKNTGKDTASDITLEFGNSEVSVKPAEMDVGDLGPGESFESSVEVLSDKGLESGFRKIDVFTEYSEDSEKKEKTSFITLDFLEEAELAMEDFKVDEGVIGENIGVTVEVENLGPGTAERLMSELSCEGAEMDVSKAFVGKLNDDESVPMVFQIVPEKRNVDCVFSIEYEDRKSRTMEVENSFVFGKKDYTRYYIGLIVLVLGAAFFVYNRRKEDELEEV